MCRSVLPVFEDIFHPILNSICNPKKLLPMGNRYSMSAVFPCVCLMCTVSFGDCSEWYWRTRPHEAPDCVDTVAYPEARQQPLKRGTRKMIRSLGTLLLRYSPPPRLKRSWSSQLSSAESSPSPAGCILLACILWMTLIIYQVPVWSDVTHEHFPGTGQIWQHQSWGRSPEILRTFCIAPAEQTLHHNNIIETEE